MALPFSSVLNEFAVQIVSDLARRSPFKLCNTLLSLLNTYIFLALQNVPNLPGGHPAPTLESAIFLQGPGSFRWGIASESKIWTPGMLPLGDLHFRALSVDRAKKYMHMCVHMHVFTYMHTQELICAHVSF